MKWLSGGCFIRIEERRIAYKNRERIEACN